MQSLVILALGLLALAQAMTWEEFKSTYNKEYASAEEEAHRQSIFHENTRFIRRHNAIPTRTFAVGMNLYGDLTAQEFGAKTATKRRSPIEYAYPTNNNDAIAAASLPPSQDWRTSGCIGHVANQGQCGSAFMYAGKYMIEAYNCLKHQRKFVEISMQDMIDCASTSGCNGGLLSQLLQYCVKSGIDSEASYPTTGTSGTCKHTSANVAAQCISWHTVTPPGNETGLTDVLATRGPVACAIDASHSSFQFYTSGVYSDPSCSAQQLDHDILNVGYGTLSGTDYYILQNSWGTAWGMSGYMLMARNHHNMCGIASSAVWVTVK